MSTHPPARAVQIFLISLAVAAADFTLAKWVGLDQRSWHVVLSAALVTAALIALWSLVANSLKATSRARAEPPRGDQATVVMEADERVEVAAEKVPDGMTSHS